MANASTPTTGSGSFTSVVSNISVRQADGNTIITATETQKLSGLFNGTRVAEGIQVIHPDGTFNAHDTGARLPVAAFSQASRSYLEELDAEIATRPTLGRRKDRERSACRP